MFISTKALLGYASLLGLIISNTLGTPSASHSLAIFVLFADISCDSLSPKLFGLAVDARNIASGAQLCLQPPNILSAVTSTVTALVEVKNACEGAPAPYSDPLIAAYFSLQAAVTIQIPTNPSTCILGGAASGTLTIIPVIVALINTAPDTIIAYLIDADGVVKLFASLPGGLVPGYPILGATDADEALFTAICAFFTAIAAALHNHCPEVAIIAIITALNVLLNAIIGLWNLGVGCTCLTSLLITAINSLVATLLATLGLL
ncbi:hypothetical protein B0H12DRAFT_1072911 [Mycena haematopus]|nr:hypothetical protein B0H12DRAFT_1072911 [Mycena haematopus]